MELSAGPGSILRVFVFSEIILGIILGNFKGMIYT